MLTFYFCPGSSSMAPHIALHEVGAAFEPKLTRLHQQQNRNPGYLALNPEGKVPTLVLEDGFPLTEVAAILWYLARRYPEAGLLPAGDIEAESKIISWMSFIAASIHPSRRAGVEAWRNIFRLTDAKFGQREWAVGDHYTIADIHLFRLFWRFVDALHPDRPEYPNLYGHYDRVLQRPAVMKTIEIETGHGYHLP
ncbi:MAG: glutathione S-transferase family protein [Alphaproteobacteria bacterium]|nr:glutathione S-transferase family protein [Alphaproteobacteria bacterium]